MTDHQDTPPLEHAKPEPTTLATPGFATANGVDHLGRPVVLTPETAAALAQHDLLLGRTRRPKQRPMPVRAWT